MSIRPLDLMEPEETVGNIWHGIAATLGEETAHLDASASLEELRPSLSCLFRALGGARSVEIAPAPATRSEHRLDKLRKLGNAHVLQHQAYFDGERLLLPPCIACFSQAKLNRTTYFWLTAMAALAEVPELPTDPAVADWMQLHQNHQLSKMVRDQCPGLRQSHHLMRQAAIAARPSHRLPKVETMIENAILETLSGREPNDPPTGQAPKGYCRFAPVPFWLSFGKPGGGGLAEASPDQIAATPAAAATTTRKLGLRSDTSEAMRKDSFIIHRFEAILSWVESMNLNRSVDDDDDENAQKAAEDQDNITLSRHDRRAATRLRLHLDLSPGDAEHERLAGEFIYPEWNHRSRSYMTDHCRVLEADVEPAADVALIPDPKGMRDVRRQFETLHPRTIHSPRQLDGDDLDLDALIAARVDLQTNGYCSDRIYLSHRRTERDLSVAILLDTSRSTEAAVGETNVIDVARDALAALAGGIDATGDRFAIWGFSSLRRDRVFLHRCKTFDAALSPDVLDRICSLKPGHYTRLGAAIRHVSTQLDTETARCKLLLVLTDGKPNDLDHYEGQHGIEDSHMAIREARNRGQAVHGIVIDEDGQNWFARLFGKHGFTLLPQPQRLTKALPDIYRALILEI
ncbi:nitric oxide reductase activation protein NorD [Roseobacter sp. EG26]|uniref:nitric oxide reductase activation protein NorD n=1 Tax=Roseobacter sp. EG26 TaxID=3412477 RepID=UPI003CE50824